MVKEAIYHIPDYPYVDPIDTSSLYFRLRAKKGDEIKRIAVHYGNKYLFSKSRHVIDLSFERSDGLFSYYSAIAPLDDRRIAYVFELVDRKGDSLFLTERGLTESYRFEDSYKDYFQFPYVHESDCVHVPSWVEGARFYQIFPDRFKMGNRDKDLTYVNMAWGASPKRDSHAGGDLRGIIDSLDYIKEVGANAIYLTPIFLSGTNHKYDTLDYMKIDPQFGSEDDLRELIDKAHRKGMRIILDGVYNHMSFFSDKFQDVVENGYGSPYAKWFCLKGEKPSFLKRNYETFSSAAYMPKINVDNAEAEHYLQDVALHYLELGIDGWRLDVGDEISHRFWRRLHDIVKERFPEAILIGENWHVGPSFLRGDEFDGMMNYPLYYAMVDFIVAKCLSAKEMADRLNDIYLLYRNNVTKMMLNLIDSHDTARFITLAKGNVKALETAMAIIVFYPGMPCIYYGDEIPLEGGMDPDCRRCFPWEKAFSISQHSKTVRSLLDLKSRELFRSGEFHATEKNGLLRLERRLGSEEAALEINMGKSPISVDGKPLISNASKIDVLSEGEFAIRLG